MKKKLLIAGLILFILAMGWIALTYWQAVTSGEVPKIVRYIPSFAPELPEVPLTPQEEGNTVGDDDSGNPSLNLTLQEKTLYVPPEYATGLFNQVQRIRVPESAQANVFVAGLGKIRMMALSPEGWAAGENILYATEQRPGRVLAFPDRNDDGIADEVVVAASGLLNPNGIAFHDGALWVATEQRVLRYQDNDGDMVPENVETIVSGLPEGGGHVTRTIAFDDAGYLYVSIGSSCNVCVEGDERRAAVMRFHADGSDGEIFTAGNRNAVGLAAAPDPWDRERLVIWATENGRDWLGDNLPPEEVNILRRGEHYGWPYCYGNRVPDRTFANAASGGTPIGDFCLDTLGPVAAFQAHSAPLGIDFLNADWLPSGLLNSALVALHGSWNRSEPVGHEIIRLSGLYPENGAAPAPRITTFVDFQAKGSRDFGRPVHAIDGPGGAIFITDDAAGAVYRVSFSL